MTKAGQRMIEGLKEAITMKQLMDENERLKRELACAKDAAKWEADRAYQAILDCNELVADNNTLREALKLFTEIENYPDAVLMERIRAARKALGETDN